MTRPDLCDHSATGWTRGCPACDPRARPALAVVAAEAPAQPREAPASTERDQPPRAHQLRERLLTSEDLDQLPAPAPLIDGVLWRDSLVELWGKPGCGKSFLALDWTMCVATGKAWQAHATTQGRALYIVGEGLAGIGKRRRAWASAWRAHDRGQLHWLRGAVPLAEPGWVDALAEVVTDLRPALVVVDTLSRALAGQNENAAEVMSGVVAASDRIRAAAGGACVLLVHHATKEGTTNRGHSALEGAADVRWHLAKDQAGALVLSQDKAKDEAALPDLNLRLRLIELPDSNSSCIVESHGPGSSVDERTASEERLLAVMRDSFGTTGASAAELRETAALVRSTHYRALNALLTTGALLNTGTQKRPFYVLPGSGGSR